MVTHNTDSKVEPNCC